MKNLPAFICLFLSWSLRAQTIHYSSANAHSHNDYELQEKVNKMHSLGKPVRFWNAPDNRKAWNLFMSLQVDFINTDHIEDLSSFLSASHR